MTTVAVTGARGYIGQHTVRSLENMGARVICIDRAWDGCSCSDSCVAADILSDSFCPGSVFAEVPDVCLHLAWRNGFNHGHASHMMDLSAHYRFVQKMVEFGVKRIAVMGSMHEVGYWEGPVSDSTPCNPLSLYGIAKDCLRRALFIEEKQGSFTLQWLRGFYIYGDDEESQSIFGKLYRAAREGKKTFPFTSGKNKYDFLPVSELGKMIAACVMQEEVNGIINCCSGVPVSLGEQVESFIEANALDISLEYGVYPEREYDSPAIWGDATKIKQIMENAGK